MQQYSASRGIASPLRFLLPGMLIAMFLFSSSVFAQGPKGKSFGIGFSVGEPTALSLRFWTSRENSWDVAVGSSYIGNPHIHADYLWHFNDAFNSRIVTLYAGVGAAIGLGDKYGWVLVKYKKGKIENRWYYDRDHETVIAAKGTFGLNIIPRNTPLDIFLEINPIIGLSPGFGFDIMPALGIRFYP